MSYRLYEIEICYLFEFSGTRKCFSYMDIIDKNKDIEEYLFDTHSYEDIVEDVSYREVKFDGFEIEISKKGAEREK